MTKKFMAILLAFLCFFTACSAPEEPNIEDSSNLTEQDSSLQLNYQLFVEDFLIKHKDVHSFEKDSKVRLYPVDFILPDEIPTLEFAQDEMGYWTTDLLSADSKYKMYITIADFTFDGKKTEPTVYAVRYDYYNPIPDGTEIVHSLPDSAKKVMTDEEIKANCLALTKMTAFCLHGDNPPETPHFNYGMFLALCATGKYSDENFKYNDVFPSTADMSDWLFPVEYCNGIIGQVFNPDWNAYMFTDFSVRDGYAKIPTRVGWGYNYHNANIYSDMTVTIEGDTVYCTFEMMAPDIDSDPSIKSIGLYNAYFDIVNENNDTYLRFVKFSKA